MGSNLFFVVVVLLGTPNEASSTNCLLGSLELWTASLLVPLTPSVVAKLRLFGESF